jgi:hypothetical protein
LERKKEQVIIDEIYQFVIELRERLRKIKEIKSFIYELSSLSSSQQSITVTGLGQTPIIQPTIPPIATTAPMQPTPPQPAQSSQEKKMIINPEIDLITNLFITSTLIVPEIQRRLRGRRTKTSTLPGSSKSESDNIADLLRRTARKMSWDI